MISDRGHVLFVNRVYPPTIGASGQTLQDLAEALVRKGWRVSVASESVEEGAAERETSNGVVLLRRRRRPATTRAGRYIRAYRELKRVGKTAHDVDVVVTETDPPLLAMLGPPLARHHRAALVHHVKDLYPEAARALGAPVFRGPVYKVLHALSTRALSRHDQIVTIGRCMKTKLLSRGLGAEKIRVIPHGPLEQSASVLPENNSFRREHAPGVKAVVMYAGNMGRAHPFGAILDAIEALQEHRPEIVFLLIGDGHRRSWISEQVRERVLRNVTLLPYQPLERLGEMLSAADIHLVSMDPKALGLLVPSKTYGVAAAARPSLFLGPEESEAARFLQECGGGEVIELPTGARLADAIEAWVDDPERRERAGRQAREAALALREYGIEAWDALLRSLVASG